MSLGSGGRRLKLFKSLGRPIRERSECFLYHAPELSTVDFDEFSIQVQSLKETGVKCRRRFSRKFLVWSDWDLKKVTVTRLKDGLSKEFEGSS